MKLLLAFVIILVVSILGSRLTFLNRGASLGFRNIVLTGTEYIFIGVLLGSMGLNVLDAAALKLMEPFLVLGLCWIGFLFGLQFKVRQLKTLPKAYFSISAVQAFVTFLLVGGAMYWMFERYFQLSRPASILVAVILGSTASCTAQSALAIVGKSYKFKNRRVLELMRYISGIDGFYALCFFVAALSIMPGGVIAPFDLFKSIIWLLVSIAIGVVPGIILIYLSRVKFTQQEFFVFLIGTVLFCGGIAHQTRYSPLIAGLVCGIVTANFCRHHLRALSEVLNAEKSIYIILLLLLGASWNIKTDASFITAGIYVLIRIAGKLTGAFAGTRLFKPDYEVPPGLGLGLISDGGLSAAVIIDVKLLIPTLAEPLVTIIILSVFFNELVSPWLILTQFDKDERSQVKTGAYRKPKQGYAEKE